MKNLKGKKLNKKEQQIIIGGGQVGDIGGLCKYEGQHCIVISSSGTHSGHCHKLLPDDYILDCIID